MLEKYRSILKYNHAEKYLKILYIVQIDANFVFDKIP